MTRSTDAPVNPADQDGSVGARIVASIALAAGLAFGFVAAEWLFLVTMPSFLAGRPWLLRWEALFIGALPAIGAASATLAIAMKYSSVTDSQNSSTVRPQLYASGSALNTCTYTAASSRITCRPITHPTRIDLRLVDG